MRGNLAIKNDLNSTLKEFFSKLFDQGTIEYLLVPQRVPSGESVVQTLINSKENLSNIDPFAPVLMGNSARLISDFSFMPQNNKVGVVLRGCEIRALVELTKLKQINLENIIIIGLECLGTIEPLKFKAGESEIRGACQRCEYAVPHIADIKIGIIGLDIKKSLSIELSDKITDELAKNIGVTPEEASPTRNQAIQKLIKERQANKQKALAEFKEKIKNVDGLLKELALCRRCYNCRVECPICACRECVFDTDTFKHQTSYFFNQAKSRGRIQMPADKLLFHLTRLNHMVSSCVACGQCKSACPNNLPVDLIFSLIGEQTQKVFDYVAGQSLEAEAPLTTFREEELEPR